RGRLPRLPGPSPAPGGERPAHQADVGEPRRRAVRLLDLGRVVLAVHQPALGGLAGPGPHHDAQHDARPAHDHEDEADDVHVDALTEHVGFDREPQDGAEREEEDADPDTHHGLQLANSPYAHGHTRVWAITTSPGNAGRLFRNGTGVLG